MDEAKLLEAINQMMDEKLAKQTEKITKEVTKNVTRDVTAKVTENVTRDVTAKVTENVTRDVTAELKAFIKSNNVAIGEILTEALEATEQRLIARIDEVEAATIGNSYRLSILEGRRKA